MDTRDSIPMTRPKSDVSAAVGLVGLAGLFAWVLFARAYRR